MNASVMNSTVALALMAKTKLVFESDDTFLSFPLSPVAYTRQSLAFTSNPIGTPENLHSASEFSRLVNLIPAGVIWQPAQERYLWDVFDDVLSGARLATSIRTPEEEQAYLAAFGYLHRITAEGFWEDTPAAKTYNQYRDQWFIAQQDYNSQKITAENSSDPAIREKWTVVTEPILSERIHTIEALWLASGFKAEVEEARRLEASLGAKLPTQIWAQWRQLFDKRLDMITDTSDLKFVLTGFSPSDAITSQQWATFTLTRDEVNVLVNQAPEELRARLTPSNSDLDIESLKFDYTSVGITRGWFASEVFKSRFWKLDDPSKLLSDGQMPPHGQCPSYVAGLVLAHNVELRPRPVTDQSSETIHSLQDASGLSVGLFEFKPLENRPLIDSPVLHSPHLAETHPFVYGHVPLEQPTLSSDEMRHLNPIERPLSLSSHTLENVNLVRPTSYINTLNRDFSRVDLSVLHPIPLPPPEPPHTQPSVTDEEAIFVVAFICKRLPQCPNPDPTLTWS